MIDIYTVDVFCMRPFRLTHFHPDNVKVDRFTPDRPHLGSPHEHQAAVTVWSRSAGLERSVDLLELQRWLDSVLPKPYAPTDFKSRSFESICTWFYDACPTHLNVFRVQVVADGVEGAIVEWLP